MKKKFLLLTGLLLFMGISFLKSNFKDESSKINFVIENILTNVDAACEGSIADEVYDVTPYCDRTPQQLGCSTPGTEDCCISTHCN